MAALQWTTWEVALLKKGQNLVSQGRSIESRESELAHERRDLVTADSELLSIRVSSCATAPLQNRETQRVIRAHVATVGREELSGAGSALHEGVLQTMVL